MRRTQKIQHVRFNYNTTKNTAHKEKKEKKRETRPFCGAGREKMALKPVVASEGVIPSTAEEEDEDYENYKAAVVAITEHMETSLKIIYAYPNI